MLFITDPTDKLLCQKRKNMADLELFEQVTEYVRQQGVMVRFKRGKPLSHAVIQHVRAKAFIPIPASLMDLYSESGDGMEFGWSSKVRGPGLQITRFANSMSVPPGRSTM